jgi:hypothetical protein
MHNTPVIKKTVSITFTLLQTCRALLVLRDVWYFRCNAWTLVSRSYLCSIAAPSVLSSSAKRECDEHMLHHFAMWQWQTHPAVLRSIKILRMRMKVPSTAALSFPTLSPLLTAGRNIVGCFLDRPRIFIPQLWQYKNGFNAIKFLGNQLHQCGGNIQYFRDCPCLYYPLPYLKCWISTPHWHGWSPNKTSMYSITVKAWSHVQRLNG